MPWTSARRPSATRPWAHRSRSPTACVPSYSAGVRHIALDPVGPYEERNRQIERIAREVFPLLNDLR